MNSSALDGRDVEPAPFPLRVSCLEVLDHEVERRVRIRRRRAGHEHQVGTAAQLQNRDLPVGFDLSHPDGAPELG